MREMEQCAGRQAKAAKAELTKYLAESRRLIADDQTDLDALNRSQDGNGEIQVREKRLRALDHEANGLSSIEIADQFFYVKRSGRLAAVLIYDNGADSFPEGMASTRVDGKIGFIVPVRLSKEEALAMAAPG